MTKTTLHPWPTPRAPRYQTLDAWRGIACLMVIVYHATLVQCSTQSVRAPGASGAIVAWTNHGSAGVPLFFVISGYCISAAADSARRREHSVKTYFWRRFRRIFPPLWAMIVLSVLFVLVVDYWLFPGLLSGDPWPQLRPWWYSKWQWFGNLTLTETWRHYVIGGSRGHFPGQAWTLCYEEQFYAITGLLLLVAVQRFFAAGMVITALVAAAMVWSAWSGVSCNGFFFDGSWMTFAAGMVVYYRVNYADRRRGLLLDGALAAASVMSLGGWGGVPGGAYAFPFALLLSILNRWDETLSRAAWLIPFTFCGQMCYSLYLAHQIPTKAVSAALYRAGVTTDAQTLLVTVPASIAVSLLLGWLFYLGVERRFLNTPATSRAKDRMNEIAAGAEGLGSALNFDQAGTAGTFEPSPQPANAGA